MESFKDYLSKIKFTVLDDVSELKEYMLFNLDIKEGFVIENKYDVYISRKFEPMELLNVVTVFESFKDYYVIDMLGVVMFEGEINDVIEYVKGFFSCEPI